MLLTGTLAASIFISPLLAQSTAAPGTPTAGSAARHSHPDPFAGRAGKYYTLVWGVDALTVKAVEAGELIRFSYAATRDCTAIRIAADLHCLTSRIDGLLKARETGTGEPR